MGSTSCVMHSDTSSGKFPVVPRRSDMTLQAVFFVIKPTVPFFVVTLGNPRNNKGDLKKKKKKFNVLRVDVVLDHAVSFDVTGIRKFK